MARTMINFQVVSRPSTPPLGSNFFKALTMDKFNNDKYSEKIESVYTLFAYHALSGICRSDENIKRCLKNRRVDLVCCVRPCLKQGVVKRTT